MRLYHRFNKQLVQLQASATASETLDTISAAEVAPKWVTMAQTMEMETITHMKMTTRVAMEATTCSSRLRNLEVERAKTSVIEIKRG